MKTIFLAGLSVLTLHFAFAQTTQTSPSTTQTSPTTTQTTPQTTTPTTSQVAPQTQPVNPQTNQQAKPATSATSSSMIKVDTVPAAINKAFAQKYPDVKNGTWYRTNEGYMASYRNTTGMQQYINYDANGVLINSGMEVRSTEAPKGVTEYVTKTYPNEPNSKVYAFTRADGSKYYQVMVNNSWLKFDEQGNLIPGSK